MKYNDETSMNPHLQQEIQECLTQANESFAKGKANPVAMARLSGICTALHALADEIWDVSCQIGEGYVLLNEDKTECIKAE